jgi:hypothetical protein
MMNIQHTFGVLPCAGDGHAKLLVAAGGDVTAGMAGTTGDAATGPTMGDALIVGIAAAELTPRLPISMDPSGIPLRAKPPGVVGDVEVGMEDEAMLLEPEPHIPDMPEVSTIPDVAGIPDVAAVAGAVAPTVIPPPS